MQTALRNFPPLIYRAALFYSCVSLWKQLLFFSFIASSLECEKGVLGTERVSSGQILIKQVFAEAIVVVERGLLLSAPFSSYHYCWLSLSAKIKADSFRFICLGKGLLRFFGIKYTRKPQVCMALASGSLSPEHCGKRMFAGMNRM